MLVLASVPCMVEAAAVGGAATAIFGMPFFWALLLGFLLADVSPAVTVPLLLDFHLKGYGTKKGIPTVLLAASGLNSVFAIIGYGVVFGLVFSARPIWQVVVLGFTEVFVMGIAVGYLIGKWLLASRSD